MKKLNNINDLTKVINGRISLAMKMTQKEIYDAIYDRISDYYKEKVFRHPDGGLRSTPFEYDRTYQFLNSLIKTDVINQNGKITCSVKIDMDSLNYVQPAEIVIDMINRGFHADVSLNDESYDTPRNIRAMANFWDDAIDDLGGYDGIYKIFIKNVKKCGVPLK